MAGTILNYTEIIFFSTKWKQNKTKQKNKQTTTTTTTKNNNSNKIEKIINMKEVEKEM